MVPASLTKWMRGEKGMLKKHEMLIETTLRDFAKEIWDNVGELNDRDL